MCFLCETCVLLKKLYIWDDLSRKCAKHSPWHHVVCVVSSVIPDSLLTLCAWHWQCSCSFTTEPWQYCFPAKLYTHLCLHRDKNCNKLLPERSSRATIKGDLPHHPKAHHHRALASCDRAQTQQDKSRSCLVCSCNVVGRRQCKAAQVSRAVQHHLQGGNMD
jgi:hypothetical protein